jgi:hypothetical protein
MDKQPEELRLAELEAMHERGTIRRGHIDEMLTELRRLYALNQELLEALEKIKHHFDTDEYAWEVADAAIAKAKEQP